jgi:hypothetical protein
MLSAEDCLGVFESRRRYYTELHQAMRSVDEIYTNSLTIPLPDAAKNDKPSVPNLIAQGIDGLAARIASVVPQVTFASEGDGRPATRRASTASRTVTAWWQKDALPRKMRRRARHLLAYGLAPVMIRYNDKEKRPSWKVRDPRTTFPSVETYGDKFTPTDVIFAYKRNVKWLVEAGWESHIFALTGQRADRLQPDDQLQLVEHVDCYGSALYLMALQDPALARVDGGQWVPTPLLSYNVGSASKCVLLQYTPAPTEIMQATVPSRIALDGPSGQFNSMMSSYITAAQLQALEILAVQKGIFPDVYLEGYPGETPEFLDGPHDGRTGKVNLVKGGRVRSEAYNPGYKTDQIIDRLERQQRIEGGIPSDFSGESGDNIRTGRRGDAVLSAVIDHPIAEAQEVFAEALQAENKAAIALAKVYDGSAPRTIYMNVGNDSRKVTYVADETFSHDEHVVSYPMAGTDINSMLIANGQRVGLGTMSKRTHMEHDPAIANPEREHDLIIGEGLEQALVAAFQQQAAAGAIPPLTVARVMDLVTTDKMEFAQAVQKAAQEAAEAAQAAQQAEQGPASAEQMAAGPGASALTGSPVPGANQGQKDVRDLLATLRTPQMTIMPQRGVAQGAV